MNFALPSPTFSFPPPHTRKHGRLDENREPPGVQHCVLYGSPPIYQEAAVGGTRDPVVLARILRRLPVACHWPLLLAHVEGCPEER